MLTTPFARPAFAQALPDPTRPPASLGAPLDATGSAGDGLPRLQSVLIAPRAGGRQVAVIDGETVRLGDMFKGARVARMRPSEVVLVRGRERQVLRLEPAPAEPAGSGIARAN
ncbi:hypothetical protein IM543_11585 [Massilia sp. UMI-21]|nr:hypothetical protein IM543_11585 [Massilia sp. UMI-21]